PLCRNSAKPVRPPKLLFPFGTLLEAAAPLVARAKTCILPPVTLDGRVTLARAFPVGRVTWARKSPTEVASFPLAMFWYEVVTTTPLLKAGCCHFHQSVKPSVKVCELPSVKCMVAVPLPLPK